MTAPETIWKFSLSVTDRQIITMPRLASVLAVQMQGDTPCLWAAVDPTRDKELVEVLIVGTGHALPENWRENYYYAGTFQVKGGLFVFHVFISEDESPAAPPAGQGSMNVTTGMGLR